MLILCGVEGGGAAPALAVGGGDENVHTPAAPAVVSAPATGGGGSPDTGDGIGFIIISFVVALCGFAVITRRTAKR